MKNIIIFGPLLISMMLLPGCSAMMTFTDAFIEGVIVFAPPPPPPPPVYEPPIVVIEHPAPAHSNHNEHREIRTGRNKPNYNPSAGGQHDEKRKGHDPAPQIGKHNNNTAPKRTDNNDNNGTTRNSGVIRGPR